MIYIKEPLVSVIVPVYNVEAYLDACLNSIIHQTYSNLEIIIVEDCSTDRSRQVLQNHLIDVRIKFIQHSENRGLSAARNTGIGYAKGDYIIFVDSDDLIDTRLIESCVKGTIETGADLVIYDLIPFEDGISEADLPYSVSNLKFKLVKEGDAYFRLPHFACVKFIRMDVLKSSSLVFPSGLCYEDWLFHWHLGIITENRYKLEAKLYLYRQRDTSITNSTGNKLLDLFIVHLQVMRLVEENKAENIKNILANKIKQSHWVILTRIDSKFLTLALEKAKEAEQLMQVNNYKSDLTVRNIIIFSIICSPKYIAMPSLKLLRYALHKRTELKFK